MRRWTYEFAADFYGATETSQRIDTVSVDTLTGFSGSTSEAR